MPTDNREIYQLVAATSATDGSLIPAAEGNANAKYITRLDYCRISAEAATSTKLYNEISAMALEAAAAKTRLTLSGDNVFNAVPTSTSVLVGGVVGLVVDTVGTRMASPDNAKTFALTDTACYLSTLTASRVMVTDASNFIVSGSVTVTEINFLIGVTSNIQTQIININNAIALTLNDLGTASGAQVVDFAYTASILSANGNVTLTSSNRVTADSTNIKILASGADRTITPSASWKWIGSDISGGVVVPSGKSIVISLFTYGTAETDVWGSAAIQP